jgi:hypothetical protein
VKGGDRGGVGKWEPLLLGQEMIARPSFIGGLLFCRLRRSHMGLAGRVALEGFSDARKRS